jgi:hypothetical protein
MTGWLVMLQGFNIPSEGMWFWFEGMIDLFFYFDLALNFFTAYEVYHQGAASISASWLHCQAFQCSASCCSSAEDQKACKAIPSVSTCFANASGARQATTND